jgi:hypothetical protein
MPARQYRYVGPPEIQARSRRESHCIQVTNLADLLPWSLPFLHRGRKSGAFTATFIIDTEERLWVADRHSEHVACANSGDVLAAGEITFERESNDILVTEVTNQSTGYCPEPSCWTVVARVLDRLEIERPEEFTGTFEFRRCGQCGTTNIIKDEVYECSVCDAPLSPQWNFSDADIEDFKD